MQRILGGHALAPWGGPNAFLPNASAWPSLGQPQPPLLWYDLMLRLRDAEASGDEEMANYYRHLLETGQYVGAPTFGTTPYPVTYPWEQPPTAPATPPPPPPVQTPRTPMRTGNIPEGAFLPAPTPGTTQQAQGLPCPEGQYRPPGSAFCVPIPTPTAARPATVPYGSLFAGEGLFSGGGMQAPQFAMGQVRFVRPGPVGTYFSVPNGAFPVPWGPEDERELAGRQLGIVGTDFEVPNGAFPVPWGPDEERPADELGQAAPGVTCETTPEGGLRCSDGTYHPPGCPSSPGAQGTVRAAPGGAPPDGGFPVVPVAIAAAAAGGALLLLAGNRRLGALNDAYPTQYEQLTRIASNITAERAADAYNFAQYQQARKRSLDLVFAIKDAETNLAQQERLWEQAHRNMEALQAAQQTFDRLTQEKSTVDQEAADYRARVESNAQNILTYRGNADAIIAGLPAEFQTEARRLIDPCFKGPAMQGPSRFEGVAPDEYARRRGMGIPVRPLGLFH